MKTIIENIYFLENTKAEIKAKESAAKRAKTDAMQFVVFVLIVVKFCSIMF